MNQISNWCIDIPSLSDYEYSDMNFGVEEDKKELPKFTIYNQWAELVTRMACVFFSNGMLNNIQNLIEYDGDYKELNPKEFWVEYLKVNPTAEWFGTSLQAGMDFMKKKWLIAGYAKITNDKLDSAIDRGTYIETGAYGVDWGTTRETWILTFRADGAGIWHAFMIIKQDKEFYYVANSYGETRGNEKGRFKIRKSDIDKLFTRYAIIDKKDQKSVNVLNEYKKKVLASDIIKKIGELTAISSSESVIKELIEAKVILQKHWFK